MRQRKDKKFRGKYPNNTKIIPIEEDKNLKGREAVEVKSFLLSAQFLKAETTFRYCWEEKSSFKVVWM
jgi:hypothetical protein